MLVRKALLHDASNIYDLVNSLSGDGTLLKRAFAEAEADGFEGTDEASLLERAGIEVSVVAGSARNFKITQPGDIELAEFYLEQAAVAGVR